MPENIKVLQGHLERITYRHAVSHYTIGKLRLEGSIRLVSVMGPMVGVELGDALRLQGYWQKHEKYGEQFRAEAIEILPTDSLENVRKFLTSGFIKGIGPKLAGKLLAHFDADILDILETDPHRLAEVSGISSVKAEGIAEAWRTHDSARRALMFLQSHGVSPFYCSRIVNALGPEAVEVIKNDPYRLTMDVHEIDFFLADRIARRLGIQADDLRRFQACILCVMERSVAQGHTFVDRGTLISDCCAMLGEEIEAAAVVPAIDTLVSARILVVETMGEALEAVYLTSFYEAEIGIAHRLSAMLTVPVADISLCPDEISAEVVKRLAIQPSDGQLTVLSEISAHRAIIITGGPGTGKTTLIRAVCAVLGSAGKKIVLAAPTGRAARRLSEVTGRKASTLHKLLGYHLEEARFEKDETNPIEADVVIIDELSMVDTLLMYSFLRAVPMSAILVFVGDVFQLPPIGPGNVLSDLISSGRIRTFELTEIFRQARSSQIVISAHRVRAGLIPELIHADPQADETSFFFIEERVSESAVQTVKRLCAETIPNRFHLDPIRDVQVLTPMHKGEAGTLNLNRVLQETLNQSRIRTEKKGRVFRLGDKVMHLKNNYQKEVFNGDIGSVCEVNNEEESISVDYDGREVPYTFDELEELSLAYAISVHKSQGSEYPAVVVVMMNEHEILLQRNLLYTALTRAQQLVFLVGSKQAIEKAVKTDKPYRRLSGLSHWLKKASSLQSLESPIVNLKNKG